MITNRDDIIDSRDIIARIKELRAQLDDGSSLSDEGNAELFALDALTGEAARYAPDWEYGEALIRDSYFKAYAQELAEDIGATNPGAVWPHNCIDWDMAARDLRMDYTAVEFGDVTYWVR